jgi:hypothetical protein
MTQKITLLTIESLTELTSVHQPPCLSLYQPTHRRHPENQQDPIRFRNLVKDLETALRQKYPAVETRLLVEPFEDVARDHAFWNHTLDGLAVLGGPSLLRVFRLQRPVAELAVVADSFHTKPLRRFLQSVGSLSGSGIAPGRVEVADLSHPQVDDLLDDLGELVGKMGGRVLVIPAEQMPGRTGLAATYRY